MQSKDAGLKGVDLTNHIKEDWREAHSPLWTQIKAYIDDRYTVVEEDVIDDEMTLDNTWRSFDCSSRTGYAGHAFVVLSIHCSSTAAGHYGEIYLHRYGVESGWRYFFKAYAGIEDTGGSNASAFDAGEVKIPLNSGRFNYKAYKTGYGDVDVKIVGYER